MPFGATVPGVTEDSYLPNVRHAYDTIAEAYVEYVRDEMASQPFERAMLAVFAEMVRGAVLDVGCGTGRITAHLHELGMDVSGVDLSPEMLGIARRTYPHLKFELGSMTDLDLPDAGFGGIVAWYSMFYVPPERHHTVLSTFYRAIVPGGRLMLAFHAGDDEAVHHDQLGGYDVDLDSYRLDPERLGGRLTEAGFVVQATLVREPVPDREKAPQGYVLARKPA